MSDRADLDRVSVYLNGALRADVEVESVQRSLGGRSLDFAILTSLSGNDWLPAGQGTLPHNHDSFAADGMRQTCHVVITPAGAANASEQIHFGAITQRHSRCESRLDTVEWVSRLEDWHFGPPLDSRPEWSVKRGLVLSTQLPWIFNEIIDGQSRPNRNLQRSGPNGERLFLDYEQTRFDGSLQFANDPAGIYHGAARTWWTLAEAVFLVCWQLNTAEVYVQNPTRLELQNLPGSTGLLREVHLPLGTTLPAALDAILDPHGYTWYLAHPSLVGRPKIVVCERGQGTAVTVVHQRRRESFDDTQTNAPALDVLVDAGATRNQITVHGGYVEREITVELRPAWTPLVPPGLTPDVLSRSYPFALVPVQQPGNQRIWRDWVLNEGADYTHLNPPTFWSALVPGFSDSVRRRKFWPMLTYGPDILPLGTVGGCHVEFSLDAGATWRPIEQLEGGQCSLLENECGIRFDADEIPLQLYFAASLAKVRITACIRDDRRLSSTQLSTTPAVAAPIATLALDEGSRFVDSRLHTSSRFYNDVKILQNYKSAERDDTAALREHQERQLSTWDSLDVRGQMIVLGLGIAGNQNFPNRHYQLSDVVVSVDGRNWDLRGTHFANPVFRYPQITRITYRPREGLRFLVLETFRTSAAPSTSRADVAVAGQALQALAARRPGRREADPAQDNAL